MKTRLFVGTALIAIWSLLPQRTWGQAHKWSGEGNGLDSAGTADCLTPGLSFTTGQSGQAFSLDGTVFPDFGGDVCAFGVNDFSVSFWMQTTAARTETIFSRRSYCEPVNAIECWMSAEGTVVFDMFQSIDISVSAVSSKRINDGLFHHVAVTRSGKNLCLFVDGVLDALASSSEVVNIRQTDRATSEHPTPLTPEFIFGNGPCTVNAPGDYTIKSTFVGALDEIEIYDRCLGDDEIYLMVHPGVNLAIVNQPFNQLTLVGRQVVFHVGTVGLQPMQYQWRFNGLDIPGAIYNNLFITNAQLTDAGSYAVVVNNPAGDATSRSATLMVTNLNAPTDSLMAQWFAEGDAHDTVSGADGQMSNVSFGRGVVGAAFKMNGSGKIRCPNVLGSLGTDDFTINFWMQTSYGGEMSILGEHYECSFPGQMASFRMVPRDGGGGKSASYLVFDFGTDPMLMFAEGGSKLDDCFSQPDTSLSLVHLNDGVFHHIAAVRRANQLKLYVDGRPVQTSTTGSTLRYAADTGPWGDPDSTERPMPFHIGCGQRCLERYGWTPLTGMVGMLDEIQVHHRALSDIEVYNTYSPDPKLVILSSPQSTSILEGRPLTMSVSAGGQAPYNYQWHLNGTDISGATGSELLIGSAQLADAGTYAVTVNNSIESVTSVEAHVTVVASNSVLPGLANKWPADGTTDDLMRNSTIRTFNGIYSAGVLGQAFAFLDQTASFDENTANFGTNDFTMDFWMRIRPRSTTGPILSKKAMSSYNGAPIVGNVPSYFDLSIAYFNLPNAALSFTGRDTQSNTVGLLKEVPLFKLAPAPQYYTSSFHHIAVVRTNATTLQLYFDGSLVAQTNVPVLGDLSNDNLFRIKRYDLYAVVGELRMDMDELEIYNRALSPNEIAGIYQAAANTPRPPADPTVNEETGTMRSINAYVGDMVSLSVGQPSGPGPFTYQWTLNGNVIAGATDSTLTVTIDAASGGVYAVIVSNSSGSVTDPIASVALMLPPGSYNGLFYLDDDPTDDSSGYITLTMASTQTYSGKILQHGSSYPFSGKFSGNHSSPAQISRPGKTPLRLTLNLDGAGGTRISGVVNDGKKVVPLKAHRTIYSASNPTPQAGPYTIALTGLKSATAPNGHGFGNVKIAADGKLSLVVCLADGTTLSQGSAVANAGVWPVYIPLYNKKGSALGWLSFTNSPETKCAGELRWVKPPGAGGKNYFGGFTTKVPVIGSTFAQTTSGLGIDLHNYSVVLDGAKIYTPLNNQITNYTGNAIQFSQTGATGGSLKAFPGTGLFTGQFIHPATKLKTTVKGVVLQNQNQAAGYFLSGNLSGRVVLKQN